MMVSIISWRDFILIRVINTPRCLCLYFTRSVSCGWCSFRQAIYSMAPFPLPHLAELREKYTYNITPFTAAMSTGRRPTPRGKTSMSIFSDDEDWDEDDIVDQINCFAGIFPAQGSPLQIKPGMIWFPIQG